MVRYEESNLDGPKSKAAHKKKKNTNSEGDYYYKDLATTPDPASLIGKRVMSTTRYFFCNNAAELEEHEEESDCKRPAVGRKSDSADGGSRRKRHQEGSQHVDELSDLQLYDLPPTAHSWLSLIERCLTVLAGKLRMDAANRREPQSWNVYFVVARMPYF